MMITRRVLLLRAILFVGLAISRGGASPASAASDVNPAANVSNAELEEITVTAARRETRESDTPISLEVFTPERLDAQGIRAADDLFRLTPSVNFQRNGAAGISNFDDEDSDVSIRGIDSTAGTSTTGIYIDDVPIQTRHLSFGTVNAFPRLFDLQRVEILRGPQGTLFGASSEGGAVRFIQPEPSLNTSTGYYRAEYGSTASGAASYELGGAASFPMIDGKLGLRISASTREDGGYVDRVSYAVAAPDSTALVIPTGTLTPQTNSQETQTVRAALKFGVSDDFAISPSIYYQKLIINDTATFWRSLSNPSRGSFLSGNLQPDSADDPFELYTLKVDWKPVQDVQMTSNTSYFVRNQHSRNDNSQYEGAVFNNAYYPPPGQYSTQTDTDTQRNFVQEIKAVSSLNESRFSWVAGVYYAHLHENQIELVYSPSVAASGVFSIPAGQNGLIYNQNPYIAIDDQLALYGQADFKITPQWVVTVGTRVETIKTSGVEKFQGPLVGPVPGIANGSERHLPVTPKIVLNYKPAPDNLLYASASKGYRAGGVNANLGDTCAGNLSAIGLSSVPSSYAPDSLWSYELGSKNTFLDRRLQIDASIYLIDWKNIQQNVYLPYCGLEFADNLGKAESRGFELSTHYKVTQNLLAGLDVGYIDAFYTETVLAGSASTGLPVVTKGNILVPSPWTVNGSAEYDIGQLPDGVAPYIRVDYQFASSQKGLTPLNDPANGNVDPTIPKQPESTNLSMRSGARFAGFDVSLYGNNLLNSHPILVTTRDSITSPNYYERTTRPRTIGLTATYRF